MRICMDDYLEDLTDEEWNSIYDRYYNMPLTARYEYISYLMDLIGDENVQFTESEKKDMKELFYMFEQNNWEVSEELMDKADELIDNESMNMYMMKYYY